MEGNQQVVGKGTAIVPERNEKFPPSDSNVAMPPDSGVTNQGHQRHAADLGLRQCRSMASLSFTVTLTSILYSIEFWHSFGFPLAYMYIFQVSTFIYNF